MGTQGTPLTKATELRPRGRLSWGAWFISLLLCVYLTYELHHLQIESVKFISPRLYYIMDGLCFFGAFVSYAVFIGMTMWLDKKFRPYPVYCICAWAIIMLIFDGAGQRFNSPDMLDQAAMYVRVLTDPYGQNKKHFSVINDGHTLFVSGEFDYGFTPALTYMLDTHPEIKTVRLTSPGGVAAEGVWMGKLIRERALNTETDEICSSSCTFAFMGGVERSATDTAALGFHRPSIIATPTEYEKIIAYMRLYLIESGARPEFAEEALRHKFRAPWYPEHERLVEGHVVTKTLD